MPPKRSASQKTPDEEKDTVGASAKRKSGFIPRKIVREQFDATSSETNTKNKAAQSCSTQSTAVASSSSPSAAAVGQSSSQAPAVVVSSNTDAEMPATATELPAKRRRIASMKARALAEEKDLVGDDFDADVDCDSDGASRRASPGKLQRRCRSSKRSDQADRADHDYKSVAAAAPPPATKKKMRKKASSAASSGTAKPSADVPSSAAEEERTTKLATANRHQPAKGLGRKSAATTAAVQTTVHQPLPLSVAAMTSAVDSADGIGGQATVRPASQGDGASESVAIGVGGEPEAACVSGEATAASMAQLDGVPLVVLDTAGFQPPWGPGTEQLVDCASVEQPPPMPQPSADRTEAPDDGSGAGGASGSNGCAAPPNGRCSWPVPQQQPPLTVVALNGVDVAVEDSQLSALAATADLIASTSGRMHLASAVPALPELGTVGRGAVKKERGSAGDGAFGDAGVGGSSSIDSVSDKGPTKPKNVECHICRKLVRRYDLNKHVKNVHSGDKPNKCPYCEYASPWKGNLNTHIAGVHLKTRTHECARCKLMFKTRGAMIGHMRKVHDRMYQPKERNFECEECHKKFFKKFHLQRHERVHTGLKPYVCAFCEKRFTSKTNMDTHIQSVHLKIKPFKCGYCEKGFGRKKLMLHHIRKFHMPGVDGEPLPTGASDDDDEVGNEDDVDEELSEGGGDVQGGAAAEATAAAAAGSAEAAAAQANARTRVVYLQMPKDGDSQINTLVWQPVPGGDAGAVSPALQQTAGIFWQVEQASAGSVLQAVHASDGSVIFLTTSPAISSSAPTAMAVQHDQTVAHDAVLPASAEVGLAMQTVEVQSDPAIEVENKHGIAASLAMTSDSSA